MNDTFTDSDGDIWERGNEPGSAIWCKLEYRLIAQEVKQLACGQWTRVRSAHIARCAQNAIAALWPEAERPNSTPSSGIDVPTPRRIIQLLSLGDGSVCAMCSDHTVWRCNDYHSWRQLPTIPQGDQ